MWFNNYVAIYIYINAMNTIYASPMILNKITKIYRVKIAHFVDTINLMA
jgi:hypothetical protein